MSDGENTMDRMGVVIIEGDKRDVNLVRLSRKTGGQSAEAFDLKTGDECDVRVGGFGIKGIKYIGKCQLDVGPGKTPVAFSKFVSPEKVILGISPASAYIISINGTKCR